MKYVYAFLLFCFSATSYPQETTLPNLEKRCHDCVLESKQITISGYPDAFNPSIIRWHNRLLLSFRFIPDAKQPFTSYIALCWLKEDFSPKGRPQILKLRNPLSSVPSRIDDARLIEVNGRLHVVYSDNEDPVLSRGGFRVHIAKIMYKNKRFTVESVDAITSFDNNDPNKREKNWVPFIYDNHLLLAYSINPHTILCPTLGTNHADTLVSSAHKPIWKWGELRGGTQALLNEDHYLSFFHSSLKFQSVHSEGKDMHHYFMGAYIFSAEPPFNITHISPEPIIGKTFYDWKPYKPYWGSMRGVFPCGFVSNDEYIWITFGKQDHEMWVTKLDKKKLYASLVPTILVNPTPQN